MSASRLPSRLLVVALALLRSPTRLRRRRPAQIRRILIAHHLLLGDTLMLTPLLAKLREQYPLAEIWMTVPKAFYPLYATAPYGVRAIPYDPRDFQTSRALIKQRGFDLALLPADNRYSWLAFALGSRWISAFDGDPGGYKNWLIDELHPYSMKPTAWGDTVTELIDGPPPQAYDPNSWPAPDCKPFDRPPGRYCVLHLGASNSLKLWEAQRWRDLADWLNNRGFTVVWSAGRHETDIVQTVDPKQHYRSYAGELDLNQLWHLLAKAALLVCPDTGVAHLGRVVNVPTVTLFGPGSAFLCGPGEFWCNSRYASVTVDPFPCRDQHVQHRRLVDWVRRCERFPGAPPNQCPEAKCMQAITLEAVKAAAEKLLRS
jgi:ADP-heptose:LPS heptosyltransferase